MLRRLGAATGPLIVAVVLLAGAEGALRLAGFETRIAAGSAAQANLIPLFRPATGADGTALWQRPDVPVAFRRVKPPNGLRVFVLGESSVLGWPFGPEFAFSRFLGDRLAAAFPDRVVEVVNCGVNAIGSADVRRIVEEEVVRYAPDVLIIYTGHNDWWVPRRRELTPVMRHLVDLRLFQLAAAANARWRRWRYGQLDAGRMKTLDAQFGDAWRRARSEATLSQAQADDIVREFAENLRAMVRAAQRAGATVILGTLGQNLRDFPPGASRHRRGLSADEKARWTALVEEAQELTGRGACGSALRALGGAFRIDRRPALTYYARARCLDALGHYGRARASYRIASDRDEVPMGVRSRSNDAIRAVAAETGVLLVDVPGTLAQASPHGLVGHPWFFDHLHPTFAGHIAIARAFAPALGAPDGSWPDPVALEAAHPEVVKQEYVATILVYLMLGWYDAADRLIDAEVERFPDLAANPEVVPRLHAAIAAMRADDPSRPPTDLPIATD